MHPKRAWVERCAQDCDMKVLCADGFEDAIVGIATQFHEPFVVYSRPHCLKILRDRDGMTEEEAEEYFDFNVAGAYVGENTPAFIDFAPFLVPIAGIEDLAPTKAEQDNKELLRALIKVIKDDPQLKADLRIALSARP